MKKLVIAFLVLTVFACSKREKSIDVTEVFEVDSTSNVHEEWGVVIGVQLDANDEDFTLSFIDLNKIVTAELEANNIVSKSEFLGNCNSSNVVIEADYSFHMVVNSYLRFYLFFENVKSNQVNIIKVYYFDKVREYVFEELVAKINIEKSESIGKIMNDIIKACEQ